VSNTEDFSAKAAAFVNDFAANVGARLRLLGHSAQTGAALTAEIGAQISAAITGDSADPQGLIAALKTYNSATKVRLDFEDKLIERARADRKTIVLPESEDERVLRAAAELLRRDVVDLVLLGEEDEVRERAAGLELDLEGVQIVSVADPDRVGRYAAEYARLRAHKGVSQEQAVAKMADVNYFGTMMVQLGEADGMVSGANHTTASTIRPALEVVKTKPGCSVVSGAFAMCLADQVAIFADCAVNPNPTAQQLADIALTTADTAVAFGVIPKVAMLSYATGASGSGADVDRMAEAARIVKEQAPGLAVDGPLQFDAAVDKQVAALKRPESLVAGQATVFVFPDLEAGNIGYKAVQRTSGALAIGPILQGLRKPVNDLSRGALVADIVNTVIITAVQAG
jgi:phosphate acetyltransferase